jgi:tetratricopeptide (TPR) repeat protein
VADYRGNKEVADLLGVADEAAFSDVARNYRAATIKPTLPEEAHKFKAQAEYALNKKEFEVAVARYKEALNVAPWWPEGHFNRALILGELSRYRDAIREMKKYLMLVPDAPNARTARDNIYGWESELK